MKFETSLLDKILNKGLLGKRNISRPLKYNIVSKRYRGVLELMYKPRNKFEQYLGKAIHSSLPLLSYFTYRFHVERARAAGMRVEDTYHHKFFREPYITWHIYAQNFHPHTLHERVRAVHFYRKPKTLFKGFKVPDWAQTHKTEGWDVDNYYSRQAWENAMRELRSEWTPMPFVGERLEPNIINWFRIEQVGKGFSSRFFYNEEPNPSVWRHGGHMEDKNKTLYSFKYGDQHHEDSLGFDLSTTEGRKALDAEVERWRQMTPEIYESMNLHKEVQGRNYCKFISQEPHFQRALSHYRAYVLEKHIKKAVESGDLTQDEVNASRSFFDEKGLPAANLIVMGHQGLLGMDESWEAMRRVLDKLGLGDFRRDDKTSMPVEQQLVQYIDTKFNITERDLNRHLPVLISDERQREKIESLLESGGDLSTALPQEDTKHLA